MAQHVGLGARVRIFVISTGMVFVMVVLAALFFFVVDEVLSLGVKLLFGLGA